MQIHYTIISSIWRRAAPVAFIHPGAQDRDDHVFQHEMGVFDLFDQVASDMDVVIHDSTE